MNCIFNAYIKSILYTILNIYKEMINKGGSTKKINSITPRIFVLRRYSASYKVKSITFKKELPIHSYSKEHDKLNI